MGLEPADGGSISVLGDDLAKLNSRQMRAKRRDIQMILQDPYTSLNPRMNVATIVGEPFAIHPDALAGRSRSEAVRELMDRVGLDPSMVNRYPHQFSGGQRQRIALARAFLRNAEILVLDEATSQIDVESERLIHEALAEYVENRTVIMITHRASTLALADSIVTVEHGKLSKRPAGQLQAA